MMIRQFLCYVALCVISAAQAAEDDCPFVASLQEAGLNKAIHTSLGLWEVKHIPADSYDTSQLWLFRLTLFESTISSSKQAMTIAQQALPGLRYAFGPEMSEGKMYCYYWTNRQSVSGVAITPPPFSL